MSYDKNRAIPKNIRKIILEKYKNKCARIKCRISATHIHHIIPYCEAQEHKKNNLILLCEACHLEYHNTNTPPFKVWLKKPPIVIMSILYSSLEFFRNKGKNFQKEMTINKIMTLMDKVNDAYTAANGDTKKIGMFVAEYCGQEDMEFYTEKTKKWKPVYKITKKDYNKDTLIFTRNKTTGKHGILTL